MIVYSVYKTIQSAVSFYKIFTRFNHLETQTLMCFCVVAAGIISPYN